MLYDSWKDLEEGSAAAKIYFLLLRQPLTVSQISKEIYNGKVQLAHINRVIDTLEQKKYIERVEFTRQELREKTIDLRNKFWKATHTPIVEFCAAQIEQRNKGSPTSKRETLNKEEIAVLEALFSSNWFKGFYEDKFLMTSPDTQNPIRYFAFLLEEMFTIRIALNKFVKFTQIPNSELAKGFDEATQKHLSLVDESTKKRIVKAVNLAKRSLGNYEITNLKIDYYLRDYRLLFLPTTLAYKLDAIGRVPLTVAIHFHGAVDRVK